MKHGSEAILVAAVVSVGILHTLVPDHWMPIAVMARQSRWSRARTARAGLIAGFGHAVSTLALGAIVWVAGVALAVRFGHVVSLLSSLALIGFGLWIAVASWLELRGATRPIENPSVEVDRRKSTPMALLLIVGSSPMVEGIPAFFAAARFGAALLGVMAICFAASTMATYALLCAYSGQALQRLRLGALERYGEVLSGIVIALVGAVFLVWPLV